MLGAMETGYQRGKIPDESMLYEHRKHDGSLPIVGVNTFRNPHEGDSPREVVLARGSEAEKAGQLTRLHDFRDEHREEAEIALARLKDAATSGENSSRCSWRRRGSARCSRSPRPSSRCGGQYRRNV